MVEFLVALVAIFEVWSQVGGQGHLDLMPWYTKLSLDVGLAIVTVAGTVSAVSHERAWNAKTLASLALALLIIGGMAGATYYYHLHENDETDSGDENNSISRTNATPMIAPVAYAHPRVCASHGRDLNGRGSRDR